MRTLDVLSTLALLLLTVGPVVFGPSETLMWDPVTMDVEGNPEELSRYNVVLTVAGVTPDDPANIIASDEVGPDSTVLPLIERQRMLSESAPSGRYLFWVQAVDLAGNKSAWSPDPLEVIHGDKVAPAAPSGCRAGPPPGGG